MSIDTYSKERQSNRNIRRSLDGRSKLRFLGLRDRFSLCGLLIYVTFSENEDVKTLQEA